MHRTTVRTFGKVATLLVCALAAGAWPGESGLRQLTTAPSATTLGRAVTVVVDPGHGGADAGAIGLEGVEEKSVTLATSLALRDALARRGLRVVLTRDGDEARSLDQRATIANQAKADLYVTLHANASPSPQSRGAEVAWLLPIATGADRGATPPTNSTGRFALIRWDRAQDRHVERAAAVAARIAEQLQSAGTLGPRGSYQGALRLLASVDVPAVLVELGYLSNAADEAMLGSDDGIRMLASTLSDAVAGLFEHPR